MTTQDASVLRPNHKTKAGTIFLATPIASVQKMCTHYSLVGSRINGSLTPYEPVVFLNLPSSKAKAREEHNGQHGTPNL